MAYNLIIKEEADADALEAFLYYQDRKNGLGERFLQSIQDAYTKLEANPQFYSILKTDKKKIFRDIKVSDFPFVIIFEIIVNDVIVYAVHSTYKKQPAKFRSK